MLTLTIIATLAVLAPLAWLLVETSRRRWLAFAIPALVAAPLGFYAYGSSLLGYAIAAKPAAEWSLVHASIDDTRRVVYLLVRPDGSSEPRLYAVADDFERTRREAGKAQAAVAKGMAVRGKRAVGQGADDNAGEFVFYVLPPSAAPKG